MTDKVQIEDIRKERKPCTKCGITKSADQFNNQKRTRRDGSPYLTLTSWCRPCTNKYYKKYYRENFDRINERHKQYYYDNREKCLEVQKAWQDQHRAYVTYRLDFANGTYWYGSTVNIYKRLRLHDHRLAHGTHSERMMALCGSNEYEHTVLETFNTQEEARAAELALLNEHVGKELCLNSIRSAMIM